MTHSIQDNWYEHFFEGIACELWEKAVNEDWTKAEADFLEKALSVQPGFHLLDVPCGNGRHCLELAQRGYQLTGIDISKDFTDSLKEKAQGMPIQVVHGNILQVSFPSEIQGAYCLGNSFGYFPYPEMVRFIQKVAQALKPGARFVINSGMLAESILPHIEKLLKPESYEFDGLKLEIENEYLVEESCMISRLTYTQNGEITKQGFKHNVYSHSEITRLLDQQGLKWLESYQNTDMASYSTGDMQAYILCEKKS